MAIVRKIFTVLLILAYVPLILVVLLMWSTGYLGQLARGPDIVQSQPSPDGKHVAYVRDEPSIDPPNQRLLVERADMTRFLSVAKLAEDVDSIKEIMSRTHAEQEPADREAQAPCVVIEGINPYQVCEPLFEAVRIVLSHRGATYSPEYIQGVSGAAFRIAGICPCAPTCSYAMETQALPKLLGYDVKHITLESSGAGWDALGTFAEKCASAKGVPDEDSLEDPAHKELRKAFLALLSHVKEEIRRGGPVLLWNAFTTAEFDVVTGYDDTTGELIGRGSYAGGPNEYAKASEINTLNAASVGGWPCAILVGDRTAEVDRHAIEIAALREAVKHAHSDKNVDKLEKKDEWIFLEGLRCYDRWIADWGDPGKKRNNGDAYCYGIYRDTHRAAAGFLREIAPRHPSASASLRQAADNFQAETDVLRGAEALLWWKSPEGPDAARNERVAAILQEARDHYASGIGHIEKALAQIERIDRSARSDAIGKRTGPIPPRSTAAPLPPPLNSHFAPADRCWRSTTIASSSRRWTTGSRRSSATGHAASPRSSRRMSRASAAIPGACTSSARRPRPGVLQRSTWPPCATSSPCSTSEHGVPTRPRHGFPAARRGPSGSDCSAADPRATTTC